MRGNSAIALASASKTKSSHEVLKSRVSAQAVVSRVNTQILQLGVVRGAGIFE